MRVAALAIALACAAVPSLAQQNPAAPAQPAPTPAAPAQPAPAPPAPVQPAPAPPPAQLAPVPKSIWGTLPRMQLERQFAGPLEDTIIQRWRDPADGTVCYIYLPITAEHSPPTPSGYVEYNANVIGSISCLPGALPPAAKPPKSNH